MLCWIFLMGQVSGHEKRLEVLTNLEQTASPQCSVWCLSAGQRRWHGHRLPCHQSQIGRRPVICSTLRIYDTVLLTQFFHWFFIYLLLRQDSQCWSENCPKDHKSNQSDYHFNMHPQLSQLQLHQHWKLQVPGLSYNWWGFQAWDTLQNNTDNSSIDKAETSLEWQEYFPQLQNMTDALPCHIHFPVCLWIVDPHSRAPMKNISRGNEVLPQDTTHLIQRPCYQQGSPCQDPESNQTTRRPPDDHKETQTAVAWSCLLFIRSGQNHLARHSERGKKTRQTEEEVGRQH